MCTICKEVLEDEKEGKTHLFNVHPEAVNKEIKVMGVSVQGDKLSKVCNIRCLVSCFIFMLCLIICQIMC